MNLSWDVSGDQLLGFTLGKIQVSLIKIVIQMWKIVFRFIEVDTSL